MSPIDLTQANTSTTTTTSEMTSVLIYVLSYADLLARDSRAVVLSDSVTQVEFRRSEHGLQTEVSGSTMIFGLDDSRISGANGPHAILDLRGAPGAPVLTDCESTNGVFVNGRVSESCVLADGDLIEIGRSLLCYRRVPKPLAKPLEVRDAAYRLGPTTTLCPEAIDVALQIQTLAPGARSFLILAETGSGKESAASDIHRASGRGGSFRAVDCGAIAENMFEPTLFGTRRGVATDVGDTVGQIVMADHGTLLFDEIQNASMKEQGSLLRVLQENQVQPVGGGAPRPIDVLWIAASDADVDAPTVLKPQLLHRLSQFRLRLPPLRKRREDLGALTAHVLAAAGRSGRLSISGAAARALFNHTFSGNIRELSNHLGRAAKLAGDRLDRHHFPEIPVTAEQTNLANPSVPPAPSLPEHGPRAPSLAPFEQTATPAGGRAKKPQDRETLEAVLRESDGVVAEAARRLGTSTKNVYRWAGAFSIDIDRYRKA